MVSHRRTSGPDLAIERRHWAAGRAAVAGADEAGRGCLAGPVVAAAVVLPPDADLPGLDDSKRLSPEAREALLPSSSGAWRWRSASASARRRRWTG